MKEKLLEQETVAGLRQKAEQGDYPHKAPMGYKNVSKEDGSKTIIIDEKYVFYVKRAFELYDSGLYSIRSLVEKLFNEGLRTVSDRKVSKSNIDYVKKYFLYRSFYF